jgi:hypothetical protein
MYVHLAMAIHHARARGTEAETEFGLTYRALHCACDIAHDSQVFSAKSTYARACTEFISGVSVAFAPSRHHWPIRPRHAPSSLDEPLLCAR